MPVFHSFFIEGLNRIEILELIIVIIGPEL